MRAGLGARELVVGGGDRGEEALALALEAVGLAGARRRWRARPAAGAMRSSSVRSGARPPVANALIARTSLDAEPAPAPW